MLRLAFLKKFKLITDYSDDKIIDYFHHSFIMKHIILKRAKNNDQFNINKSKDIFSNMFEITSSSSILEFYVDSLFEINEQISVESKFS